MLTELLELNQEIDAKSDALAKIFEEAKTVDGKYDFRKVKSLGADMNSTQVADKVGAMNEELTALGLKREKLAKAAQALSDQNSRQANRGAGGIIHTPDASDPSDGRPKMSMGEFFIKSKAWKDYKASGAVYSTPTMYDAELKVLFQRSDGWSPEVIRTGRIVEDAQRQIMLIDALPVENTDRDTVAYMEETVFSSTAAAETSEGGTPTEATILFAEQTSVVRKISVYLPVGDETLEDEPRVRSILDNRLIFMLRQRLDGQIATGNGTAPNLRGVLNITGLQTQAKGSDPVPDAIRKAMTLVRVTGRANPDQVWMHPNDWQDVRLLRTADGIYVWGSPSESGPQRIWGLPVREADQVTENTAVVGDFLNFSALVNRRGVDLQVGYLSNDFRDGRKTIRADIRVALIFYRGAAFCQVTGI